jgi:hypothetical protein
VSIKLPETDRKSTQSIETIELKDEDGEHVSAVLLWEGPWSLTSEKTRRGERIGATSCCRCNKRAFDQTGFSSGKPPQFARSNVREPPNSNPLAAPSLGPEQSFQLSGRACTCRRKRRVGSQSLAAWRENPLAADICCR